VFIQTLLTGVVTVVGLWLIGQIFLPLVKRFELSRPEQFALKFSFGFALCSNVFLAMSPFGLYKKCPLLFVFAALSAIGLLALIFFRRNKEATVESKRWGITEIALFLILAFATVKAFLASLGPEYQPDALMYHLYLPMLYLSRGNVAYDPHNFTSGYGLLPQLVFGVPAALGEVEGGRIVHYSFFIASLAFVYGWTKSIFDRKAALFAVALLSTPHMMGWCAHTANTEYFVTFFLLASLRLLIVNRPLPIFVAGLCAGFSWVSKPIALGFAAVAFLSFALLNLKDKKGLLKKALVFALGAAIVYLPWSIRSFLGTGDPLYPFFGRFFCNSSNLVNTLNAVATSMKQTGISQIGPAAFILSPILLPLLFLIRPMLFAGLDPGMGWIFAYFAFFTAPKFFSRGILRWFAIGCLYVFFFSAQQLRFLMPMFFVLVIIAASVFHKFSRKALMGVVLLIFPIMNIYPLAKYLGNAWYLDYQVRDKYLLGRETKDEFLARYSYGHIYQVKLFMDIFDPSRKESIFSLGGADHLFFWPRVVISSSLSPDAYQLSEMIKDERQPEAIEQIKRGKFDFMIVDQIFVPFINKLVEDGSILPLVSTGKHTLLYIRKTNLEEMSFPDGFLPAWGVIDGQGTFYAWLKKESVFIARGVRKVKLKVQIPEDVLKNGTQVLDVESDRASHQSFTFTTKDVRRIEIDVNACDSKPHVVKIRAKNDAKFPAGPFPPFYSAGIRDVKIEFCDGTIVGSKKEFWPLSGVRDWEKIVGRVK